LVFAHQAGIPVLREKLGLSEVNAVDLVARVPVVVALEPKQLQMQVCRHDGTGSVAAQHSFNSTDVVWTEARLHSIIRLCCQISTLGDLTSYQPACDVDGWLQVSGLATTAGVSVASLVELLGRCLGLVAVPAEVLGAGLANLGHMLGVKEEEALDLVLAQPTLLATQARSERVAMASVMPCWALGARVQGAGAWRSAVDVSTL
jgi:hypothetical protein